ncbi:hypothetical protein ABZW30_40885 [Kitasatospora sp. NPDC004669]|uniref:hypothetical protein n=1 Tax=Kitasatospora sp. NPDC004669 TaxID=3154555 RepID=UPI0033BB06C2
MRLSLAAVRVLVIEDNDDLRFAVTAALRGDSLAVDEAADLSAAGAQRVLGVEGRDHDGPTLLTISL